MLSYDFKQVSFIELRALVVDQTQPRPAIFNHELAWLESQADQSINEPLSSLEGG